MPSDKKHKPTVVMKVLPGQPTDGTGQICIHLIVRDEKRGSFVEPHVLHDKKDEKGNVVKGEMVARPTRCRIACDRKRAPQIKPIKGVIVVLMRSDDPRAVTCLKCKASVEYVAMTEELKKRSG